MIIQRKNNNKYSEPIITKDHIEFIRQKYESGLSQIKIAKMMQVSDKLISSVMKENNINVRSNRDQALKYFCEEDFFERIDTEAKAYWLGFLYADGYILNRKKHSNYKVGIALSVIDKEHLFKFKNCIKSNHPIKTYKASKKSYGGNYCRILVSSNKMANDLINKGCVLNKTKVLSFPSNEIVPKKLIRHFIRGFVDGDGSLMYRYTFNKKNGKIDRFESKIGLVGTKEMLYGILKEFKMEHLKLDKRHKDRENNNYQINIGGNINTKKILNYLYKDSNIYLNRKYKKYLEIEHKYKQYLVELASNS